MTQTGQVISLTEYGRLHVGEYQPSKPSVTLAQAASLTKLNSVYGFDVFKWVNQNTLAAQQYVGTLQLGRLTIEVLPKIEGSASSPDDSTIRQTLVAMLMAVLDLEISDGEIARLAVQQHGILEVLIRLFCDKLFSQVHLGLVRRYEWQEENRSVLRGRLVVSEQLRLNIANPERLYCRFDEFQEDNPLNQVLKAAVRRLLKVSKELPNQRQLAELMLVFEGISDIPTSSLPWQKVAFDRLNDRYQPSFRLAELFLKNAPPDVTGGAASSFSLFFDMNKLFEEYIGRIAVRVFRPKGLQMRLQGPQRFLAQEELSGSNSFAMKPDIVGMKNNEVIWIIDTKWKQLSVEELREGASQSDLYQMYAYANNYNSPNVVLLYPHHKALGEKAGVRASYKLNKWIGAQSGHDACRIRVATIDLSNPKLVKGQLDALFPEQPSVAEWSST